MAVVLLATVLALSTLYAPQPLLPVIVREFGVSREAAAFLTTVSFIPLSIAPLFYGYLLESVPPRRLLRLAVFLLALSEIGFSVANSFPLLVAIRFFQGLLIPAMLTSLMTYISRVSEGAAVQRGMAAYIAATILGGFLGRACSGAIASAFGWRFSFLVLAVSLFACLPLLGRLSAEQPVNLVKPTPGALLEALARPFQRRMYLAVFCLFLVFAAIMNFLPFRLTEISDRASEFRIGLMYSGYVMGIATSLGAVHLARWAGGEMRAMLFGLGGLAMALVGFASGRPAGLFLVMFVFCAAMFLVHATASGLLNRHAAGRKGIVNGLYIAFYYAGGTVGSWLPGFIYREFGWGAFLAVLVGVTGVGFALVFSCRRGPPVLTL